MPCSFFNELFGGKNPCVLCDAEILTGIVPVYVFCEPKMVAVGYAGPGSMNASSRGLFSSIICSGWAYGDGDCRGDDSSEREVDEVDADAAEFSRSRGREGNVMCEARSAGSEARIDGET